MKANRYFLIASGSLLTLIVFLFLGLQSAASGQRIRPQITIIVSDSAAAQWIPFRAGLEQAARDCEVSLNYMSTDAIRDLPTQRRLMDRAVQDGADAIGVQFCTSQDTAALIADMTNRVPLALIETPAQADADVQGRYATIAADNTALGAALANEIILRYGGSLRGKNAAIVRGSLTRDSINSRYEELTRLLEDAGVNIIRTMDSAGGLEDFFGESGKAAHLDILIALDNESLEHSVDLLSGLRRRDITLFGVGCTEKDAYYLDQGMVTAMIVPEQFIMGYQCVQSLKAKLDNRLEPMQDITVGYHILHQDNMFTPENQRLLFPVVR